MKSVLLIFGLLFAMNAQAEVLYRCDLQVADKARTLGGQDRVIYLSHQRLSNIQLSAYDTELSLMVAANGKLTGYVDGKKDFILSGTIDKTMHFESSTAEGNIVCDSLGNVPAALYFKPWKTIAVQGDKELYLNLGAPSDIPNYCYIGNASDAKNIVALALNIAPDKLDIEKNGAVKVVSKEKKCIRSIGTYDDYQCLEYRTVTVARELSNCDYVAERR